MEAELHLDKYNIVYTKYILNIGCKSYTLTEWKNFTDNDIAEMDVGALAWWKSNKDIIIELVEREN